MLALSGNPAPLGFAFEYVYPTIAGLTAVEIWQVAPTFPIADPNNPIPVNWTVGNTLVGWSTVQGDLVEPSRGRRRDQQQSERESVGPSVSAGCSSVVG